MSEPALRVAAKVTLHELIDALYDAVVGDHPLVRVGHVSAWDARRLREVADRAAELADRAFSARQGGR